MATNLVEWSPEILPDIPQLPVPALKHAVRNAAILFCQESLIWTFELAVMTVVVATREYTLTADTGAQIYGIESVKFKANGEADSTYTALEPTSQSAKDLYDDDAWFYEEAAAPTSYWLSEEKKLELYPIPSAGSTDGLSVRVNQTPLRTYESLPDFLFNHYFEAIAAGAKSNLFSRTGMPWYDPQIANYWSSVFKYFVQNAFSMKTSGYSTKPTSVPVVPLFGQSSYARQSNQGNE